VKHTQPATLRDAAITRVLSAAVTLIAIATSLVLPPFANPQLASAEKTLQKPVAALAVAVAVAAASAWSKRFAIALVITAAMVAATHVAYFVVTTQPGRSAARMASHWRHVPLASGASGYAENRPDVFGRATLYWHDSSLRLDLRSETGTTQQGFHLDAGPASSRFFLSLDISRGR